MKRIRLLDVLRGFAILGTLGTNIWLFATVGDSSAPLLFGEGIPWWNSWDDFLIAMTLLLVNGKFLGMLTILFGVGVVIKFGQAQRKGLLWPWLYIWSAVLLFLDGVLHYFAVMEYDILMSYAVTAVIVSFLVGKCDRVIRWVMGCALGLHVILIGLLTAFTWIEGGISAEDPFLNQYATVVTSGSWWEQIMFRWEHFWFFRTETILILPMNIFLFLLGSRLFQSGAFSPDENGRLIRRRMLRWGLGLGIPLNLLFLVPGGIMEFPVRYLFAPILSLGYIGLIAWVLEKGRVSWLLGRMELIGKAPLSCYMLQNVLASLLFYNWGLNLTGQVGAVATLAAWFGICVVLMIATYFWLKRFPAGPFELIWKRLSAWPEPWFQRQGTKRNPTGI
jgi:uncharacterized protein